MLFNVGRRVPDVDLLDQPTLHVGNPVGLANFDGVINHPPVQVLRELERMDLEHFEHWRHLPLVLPRDNRSVGLGKFAIEFRGVFTEFHNEEIEHHMSFSRDHACGLDLENGAHLKLGLVGVDSTRLLPAFDFGQSLAVGIGLGQVSTHLALLARHRAFNSLRVKLGWIVRELQISRDVGAVHQVQLLVTLRLFQLWLLHHLLDLRLHRLVQGFHARFDLFKLNIELRRVHCQQDSGDKQGHGD
mmetsp:Transcript_14832/g.34840  ORF Transcript_14832/g.34840 Transcript_14832/m.34840 type:complete len:244 (-) Transcript_14832:49-780(-)